MNTYDVEAFDIRDAKLGSANDKPPNDHAVYKCNLHPGNRFIDMGPFSTGGAGACHILSRPGTTTANTFQAYVLSGGGLVVQSNYNMAVMKPRSKDIPIQSMSAPHTGSHTLKFMVPSERVRLEAGSIILVTKDPTISVQNSNLDKVVVISDGKGNQTKFPPAFWEAALCVLHDNLIDMWTDVRKPSFILQAFNDRVAAAKVPGGCPMAGFFNSPLLVGGGPANAPKAAKAVFGIKQFQDTITTHSGLCVQQLDRQQFRSHFHTSCVQFLNSVGQIIGYLRVADDLTRIFRSDMRTVTARLKDANKKDGSIEESRESFKQITREFTSTVLGRVDPATVEEKDAATALLSLTGKRGGSGEGGGGGDGKRLKD
jgi:hypothetical protein